MNRAAASRPAAARSMNVQPPAGSPDPAAFDPQSSRSNRSPDADFPSHGGDESSGGSSFGAGLGGSAGVDGEPAPKKRKPAARRKTATRRKKASSSTAVVEDEAAEPAPRKKRTRRKKAASKDSATDQDRGGRDDEDERPSSKTRGKSRDDSDSGSNDRDHEDSEDAGGAKKRRRRGSRGGRRRKKTTDEDSGSEDERGHDDASDRNSSRDSDEDRERSEDRTRGGRKKRASSRKKSTRRGKRSSAAKEGAAVDTIPGEEDELPEAPPEKKSKKKRKRSRSKKSGRGEDERDDDEAHGESGGSKKKRKRSSKKKDAAPELTAEEKAAAAEALRTDVIYINASDPEESRVAVVNPDGRIHDLLMTSESQKTLVNDIYRGRVVNLEPAIGAAFVDFGQGRNGFLHTSDVLPMYGEDGFSLDQLLTASVDPDEWDSTAAQATVGAEMSDDEDLDDDRDDSEDDEDGGGKGSRGSGRKKKSRRKKASSKGKAKASGKDAGRGSSRRRARLPISELLKVGDQVVVQVTKDAIGDKGPTLTTYISIPGRYLVLMPSMARTGVSRKIPDDKERRRLKRILASLKSPTEMGVIVRTAGVGKTKTDLQRDLDYLLGVWETFGRKLKSGRGPAALYQESDVAIRTLRDLFNKTTKKVVVDDPGVLEQLDDFATKLMPEHQERIQRYTGDRPIFHDAGIEQDFEKIFTRRVELASGGSVVFDQAEALVAIDVNSGRTRTDSFDFEEIALKTNLEAVPEIALQIRLRDLGGIIVCDFIDMMKSSSNRAVERALRAELAPDRARSKLGRISQFGLLELTRQRLGPGTHKKVFQACPRCRGTARIRTVESRAQAILRRLGSALTQKGFSKVEVRAHPEVVDYLKDTLWDYMRALEHRFEKELTLTEVPDQPEDSVLRYLRADGREVRPGGRRKR